MKITEEFPLTVPTLCERSGYHPELVKKLMPGPDHFSGTTPRWAGTRTLPTWRAVMILPPREKMPTVKALADVLPADLACILAWFNSMETANECRQDYVRHFWSIPANGERRWISKRAQEMGGVLTE